MTTLRVIEGEGDTADYRVRRVAKMLLEGTETKAVVMGAEIGLSKAQVWDRLRGDKAFSVKEVAAMADYFGVPVSVFFAGPAALIRPGSNTGDYRTRTPGVSPVARTPYARLRAVA